jgi:hypothetical protein
MIISKLKYTICPLTGHRNHFILFISRYLELFFVNPRRRRRKKIGNEESILHSQLLILNYHSSMTFRTQPELPLTAGTPRGTVPPMWVMPPSMTVRVRVAVRGLVAAFAAAVTLIEPSLLSEAGVTVSQDASPLAVQLTLDATVTDWVSSATSKLIVAGETVSHLASGIMKKNFHTSAAA